MLGKGVGASIKGLKEALEQNLIKESSNSEYA